MHYLVTGGCGFIGSHFIRHLLTNELDATVVNLDKLTYAASPENLRDVEAAYPKRYAFVHGDICDGVLVRKLMAQRPGPTVIVNFAAESHVDRSIEAAADFIQTNIAGTQVLLDAARDTWTGPLREQARFVQISTDEVYGALGESGTFRETTPLQPNSPYAVSKAAADMLARSYHHTYQVPVLVTRSSNNYGPYQFPEKLIPLAVTRVLADRPIPVYGDGRNVRDWLYVEDNCAAILQVIKKGALGEVYNIGGRQEVRNLEVVQKLLAILGQPTDAFEYVPDRPGHDWRYSLDSSKVEALGWRPTVGLDEGLRRTASWYRQNHAWIHSALERAKLKPLSRVGAH